MEISLQIILEKLNLKNGEGCLEAPQQANFSDVRLLASDQKILKKGILYVGEGLIKRDLVFETGCGLCLLNGNGSFHCDVLFINGLFSFAEVFNKLSQVFYEIRSLFEQLNHAIIQNNGLQSVIEIVSSIVGNPVYLVDTSFKVLGIYGPDFMREVSVNWRHLLNDGYLPYNVVMNLIESNELHSMENGRCANVILSKYFYTPFINYNIRYKEKLQGHFFVVGMLKKITPGDVELTNLVTPYILGAIRHDANFQTTRGRYYEHFIIDMLEGKPLQLTHIKNQVDALNLEMDDFYTVVQIKPEIHDELRHEQISRQLENINGCKPVNYRETIVALFPKIRRKQDSLIKKLQTLSKTINGSIGISDEIQGFNKLHLLYLQASAAITLGETMALPGKIFHYREVVQFHPFLDFREKNLLEAMCHPGVLILQKHDKQYETKFVETLAAYLKNERHSLPTAANLHIHRNTLSYRLEKILDLYGFNLDDPHERERILMTLNILEILEKKRF
jgi:sugar diacid utilization regulator